MISQGSRGSVVKDAGVRYGGLWFETFFPTFLHTFRGYLQTDFGTLNVIMTLRGEGGSGHDVINFY